MPLLTACRLLPIAGGAVAAAMLLATTTPEQLVRQGYRSPAIDPSTAVAAALSAPAHPRFGDEGFWLSRTDAALATPLPQTLSVGDRITLATARGGSRILEVVDVRALDAGVVPVGHAESRPHLLMITGKAVDGDRRLTRFIVEDGLADAKPIRPAAPKAL